MNKKQMVRSNFRDSVFARDKNKCLRCPVNVKLDAHHITDRTKMPNGGYVKENGATLCEVHHLEAEQFHISDGKTWVEGMHPNDLYKLIDSSYEIAYKASERLK